MATYANVSNQVAALKELYTGDDYMKDLVYKQLVDVKPGKNGEP